MKKLNPDQMLLIRQIICSVRLMYSVNLQTISIVMLFDVSMYTILFYTMYSSFFVIYISIKIICIHSYPVGE